MRRLGSQRERQVGKGSCKREFEQSRTCFGTVVFNISEYKYRMGGLVKMQMTIVGMSLGSHRACLAYTKSWTVTQTSAGHTVNMVHRISAF